MQEIYIMMSRRWVFYLITVAFVLLVPTSSAIMGYDIIAKVDSTTWELHRFTNNLNFKFDGNVSGTGNFSRSSHIRELAGMDTDESDYSLNGSIEYVDKIRYLSADGPVVVKADLQEYRYDDPDQLDNMTANPVLILSSADIEVDEHWPVNYAIYKFIKYKGDGIRTSGKYNNNGNIASVSYYSQKLLLEDLYKATLNRTYITARLEPTGVIENWESNRTSSFTLRSESNGSSTHLEFSRNSFYSEGTRFGRPKVDALVSEDYSGHHLINLKVKMSDYFLKPDEEESWLDCCSGGYLTLPSFYRSGDQGFGYDATSVFDCTCQRALTPA